jgi:hypothetical protein
MICAVERRWGIAGAGRRPAGFRLARRQLLGFVGAAAATALATWRAWAGPIRAGAEASAPSPADPLSPLGAWLDTLLPADGASPAASALGCEAALRERAAREPGYLRLLEAGCAWLDAQAGGRFAALDEAAREAIGARAAAAPARSLPETFFRLTRRDAFEFYYAQPRSWSALGFAGPPQPDGFPDHAGPWEGPA